MEADFYRNNRNKLVESLHGALVVVSAYTAMQHSADMAIPFRQESNFFYLCGLQSPDWKIIIDGASRKSWLVAPVIDEIHQIFDGSQSSDSALRISGVDKVIDEREAGALLRQLAKHHSLVYTVDQPSYADMFGFVLNPALKRNRSELERIFAKVDSCNKTLAVLRAIKQPIEVMAIQKAIDVTIREFSKVHDSVATYTHEYQVEADFSRAFRASGLDGHAYEPIVAAGANACTLHYTENNSKIGAKQLVLLDIGAQYSGYAADITRTYAKTTASKRQAQVHAAVERAHHEIISLLQPELSVEGYQKHVMKIMGREITQLGLAQENDSEALRKYFPHAISHGLGIDVHDSLGAPRYFQPGMVLTVEPGIYIPEEGIGVRIEDDILITSKGNKNLSKALSTGL